MSPALHDPLLVLASFLAVFALVLGARAAGTRGASPAALRRFVHASVGIWTVLVTPRFAHLGWALVPPLTFLALNASGRTERLAPALSRPEAPGAARGLWTFPLGVAVAYILFWRDPARAPVLAGCAALALADPAAAWVGSRFGQRRLHPLGFGRTLEGSIAFFLVAAIAIGVVARLAVPRLVGPELTVAGPGAVALLRVAIGAAAVGAVAEALAPRGWDNVTIPVAVGYAYRALAQP